jgi:HD-like signal output (HDOD) protein
MDPHAPSSARPSPLKFFGRFELRRLLGKSERTMLWLVFDPRNAQELMLTLPRAQPADAAAAEAWMQGARAASRLRHPHLAHVVELGVQEHWPYVAVDRALGVTLGEWLGSQPLPAPADSVAWLMQALEGLAYAHEAGAAHGDPQLHSLIVGPQGQLQLMALGAAGVAASGPAVPANERAMPMDPALLRAQRGSAQRDLVALGLLLHRLLAGEPPNGEADTARGISRMPPAGRDAVRLPWNTPQPIPEALRAIANRATSSQERQRYLGARSLLRALDGWRRANEDQEGGALSLLIDRLSSVGHLPALPGTTARVARLVGVADAQRTDEIAEDILQDMALSFELLRNVNSAQVQATQASGNGPVLTIRRAVALMGVDGVRRAANALRQWPGPMNEAGAAALRRTMDRVRLAGHTAQALRPAGYDAEVVYLVAVLQNLGRLLVRYHFPDEAEQLHALMQPTPAPPAAEPPAAEQPGLDEEAASFAVLGVGIEALGAAVARHWGLGDEVQVMIRRLSPTKAVRTPDNDGAVLRMTASAANEAVDALAQADAVRVGAALDRVAQRYARVLKLDVAALRNAVHAGRAALGAGRSAAPVAGTDEAAPEPAAAAVPTENAATLAAERAE